MFAVQDQVNTWEVGKCVMRRIVELSSAEVLYRTLFCLFYPDEEWNFLCTL